MNSKDRRWFPLPTGTVTTRKFGPTVPVAKSIVDRKRGYLVLLGAISIGQGWFVASYGRPNGDKR